MATTAQITANRQNAHNSTGPTTEAGKEVSARNNFRHGLSGHIFFLLDWEQPEDFDALKNDFNDEHQPKTTTEKILVEKMVQHHWLAQRATTLQGFVIGGDPTVEEDEKTLGLYMRYQAHHDRLFQRALHDLLKLRSERRKEQIGFESQKRAEAQEVRRESDETRKVERHKVTMATLETRLEIATIRTAKLKTPTAVSPQAGTDLAEQKLAA